MNISLYYFNDREPGYTYRVKAKMVAPEHPPMDGPAYHLEFIKMLSKEKYEGNEPFEIALIQSPSFGGPMIVLKKENNAFMFGSKIQLTAKNELIESDLENIWASHQELMEQYQTGKAPFPLLSKAIKATVTHDPEHFGKAYLVSDIAFFE